MHFYKIIKNIFLLKYISNIKNKNKIEKIQQMVIFLDPHI